MHRTLLSPETILLAVGAALALLGSAAAADFPDVSKLPSHPDLPDPLVMFNGDRVTTKEQWIEKRRPELKRLFEFYMYGEAPPAPDHVEGVVERMDPKAFDGKATLKEITISFGPPNTPKIYLLLVVPNAHKAPAPVFVGMNFHGNHTLVNDPAVRLPTVWMPKGAPGVENNHATNAGRGTEIDVWALEQSIDRGYAVATFYCGDVDPDRSDVREGIQAHLRKPGAEAGAHDWGTIAAWAWGISRVVDYLRTDKDLDKDKIAAVGHSRLGKTALLAGAFDERIGLVIPLQAGCGGTAPSRTRSPDAETVKAINKAFPHWFDGAFKEFSEQPDKLPFDQNSLAAMVAPRPLLYCNATEDKWANPPGQFEMLQSADSVYRLLGVGGLETKTMPEVGQLSDGTLGYYIRPGKHSMTKGDWKVFLDYADKHFGKPDGAK
jgi:hypothetical protein